MPIFEILRKTPDHWQPLMGFMDETGRVLITPQFLRVAANQGNHFSDAGYAIVQRPNDPRYHVINTSGATVFTLPDEHVHPGGSPPPDEHGIFSVLHQKGAGNPDLWKIEGRDRVFTGETRAYGMRLDGTIAFEAHISQSRLGHYVTSDVAQLNAKKGLITHTGDTILPPVYDAIYLSRSGLYATTLMGDETNVIRLDGTSVFKRPLHIKGLTDLREVANGLWVVPHSVKARADVYDVATGGHTGHLPLTYWSKTFPKACPTLSGGVACIQHPSKGSAYYLPDGKPAMPGILGRPRWFSPEMRVGYFNDDRASFKLGDLWGYLDRAGKHAIAPRFNSNLPFRNGLARVKYPADGNSWDRFSYIDRDGTVVWHQSDGA